MNYSTELWGAHRRYRRTSRGKQDAQNRMKLLLALWIDPKFVQQCEKIFCSLGVTVDGVIGKESHIQENTRWNNR